MFCFFRFLFEDPILRAPRALFFRTETARWIYMINCCGGVGPSKAHIYVANLSKNFHESLVTEPFDNSRSV